MKLFTAIVALAGMSSATASLRGGAVLPSDMKDLLNKLVAADEGTATCNAVVGQMCETLEGVVLGDCPPSSSCNFVATARLSNWQGATTAGMYCSQPTLEAELVEESEELQDPACKVLGPDDGGCTPPSAPGLSCKAGFTCQGYEENPSGQDPTLGACVLDTNRAADSRSHATICNQDFFDQHVECTTDTDCNGPTSANPDNCDAVCRERNGISVCVHRLGDFEEEEEELDASASDDQEDYDDVPADAAHCLPSGAACSLDNNGNEVLKNGKRCCEMIGEGDWTHIGASCNYMNRMHAVGNSDAGAGGYCVYNPGEDLAVN